MILVLLGVILTAGWMVRNAIADRRERNYAASLVRSLVTADINNVPAIVEEVVRYREWTEEPLRIAYLQSAEKSPERLRSALALLEIDGTQVDYLCNQMLTAEPADVPIVISALEPHRHLIEDRLWEALSSEEAGNDVRLSAASTLAVYAPLDKRWEQVGADVTELLVQVPLVFVGNWQEALRGVANHLLSPLEKVFHNADRGIVERKVAATILAAYVAEDLPRAVHLLCLADEFQFDVLFPLIEAQPTAAAKLLDSVLNEQLEPRWNDPPLGDSWQPLDKAARDTLISAHGIVAERFALCQTLPLDQWKPIADAMTASGYRPIRYRPYASGGGVHVAAVWTRDGGAWEVETASTPSAFQDVDSELRNRNLVPIDVSCHAEPEGDDTRRVRFVGLWGTADTETADTDQGAPQVCVGPDGPEFHEQAQRLLNDGYCRQSYAEVLGSNGIRYRCQRFAKGPPKGSDRQLIATLRDMSEGAYPGYLATDLFVYRRQPTVGTLPDLQEKLAEVDSVLGEQSDNRAARLNRVRLLARLGDYPSAMAELDLFLGTRDSVDDISLQMRACCMPRCRIRRPRFKISKIFSHANLTRLCSPTKEF